MDHKKNAVIYAVMLTLIGLLTFVSVGEYMLLKNCEAKAQAQEEAETSGQENADAQNNNDRNEQVAQSDADEEKAVSEESEERKEEPAFSADGVERHGQLRLDGTEIVDEHGTPVRLRGMSSHGLMWYPQYTNYSAVKTTADYGANLFRIAMYSEDPYTGYNVNKDLNTSVMYSAIENVKAADLYVIVDWHVLDDKNPLNHVEEAKGFFEEISSHYGDDPAIIYEICNEPNGETTWEDIRNYATQVIPIIRSHAPNALVIVGTPNYSYDIDSKVWENRLEYENVLYSFHYYAGLHTDKYRYILEKARSAGLPVFVSEWGIDSDKAPDASEQAKEFVSFMKENGISFAAWSLCNKEECFSAIRSDCDKLGDWTKEDLTPVGEILFDALSNE